MKVLPLRIDSSPFVKIVNCFNISMFDMSMAHVQPYLDALGGVNIIVTTNLSHVASLDRGEMAEPDCYYDADLVLCDSRVLNDICTLMGKGLTNVIPGSDLTEYMFDNILSRSDRVMILGSTFQDVQALKRKYDFTCLEYYSPPFGFIESKDEIDKIILAVKEFNPRYVFLALGSLRQEALACKLKPVLHNRCDLYCIGASIDFLVGAQKRAPKVFRRLHLEWFYRLLTNPRRLIRRYFLDFLRLFYIFAREVPSLITKSSKI